MPPSRPPGRGVRSQYNGLHPLSRSWGIDSPCCVRFERRTLSFAHALVGTVVCVACGVLPKFWNTYLGHIGPASVMFILSELERFPGPNTVVTQGWTAILGGAGYLTYDLLFHGCGLDMSCHGLREQQHISVNTLLICIGIDMVIHRSRFSASLIGLGFALFVGLHPQPNSMGILVHQSAGVMLVVYAVARLCSRFDVCSKALYYASYLFFYGQNGFMALYGGNQGGSGEEMPEMMPPSARNATAGDESANNIVEARINDTAYVLFVLCAATVMSTLTETIDYAFAEGVHFGRLGAALMGNGKDLGKEFREADRAGGVEFEMIKLVDDFEEREKGAERE